jgi:hypothetical protein
VPQFLHHIAAGIMPQQPGDMSLNQLLKNEPDKADLYYQDAIWYKA